MGFDKGYTPWNKGTAKSYSNICQCCGIEYSTRDKNQKYCSYKCSHDATKGQHLLTKICETCGSSFLVFPHDYDERRFCQIACRPPWNKGLTKDTDSRIAKPGIRWQDPNFRDKTVRAILQANGIHPNKAELCLAKILHPYGFKFVGDGSLVFAGKCPDFVDHNRKLIIELLGCWWHGCPICKSNDDSCDNEEKRLARSDHFTQFGYKTLYVWEHELQDKNLLLLNIEEFING